MLTKEKLTKIQSSKKDQLESELKQHVNLNEKIYDKEIRCPKVVEEKRKAICLYSVASIQLPYHYFILKG